MIRAEWREPGEESHEETLRPSWTRVTVFSFLRKSKRASGVGFQTIGKFRRERRLHGGHARENCHYVQENTYDLIKLTGLISNSRYTERFRLLEIVDDDYNKMVQRSKEILE